MNLDEFKSSLTQSDPPATLSTPLAALWWDAKGDWTRAHNLVDELELKTAWPSTPTSTAKEVKPTTPNTGTPAPAATITAQI